MPTCGAKAKEWIKTERWRATVDALGYSIPPLDDDDDCIIPVKAFESIYANQ